jgi:hypothetical protein
MTSTMCRRYMARCCSVIGFIGMLLGIERTRGSGVPVPGLRPMTGVDAK